MAITADGTRACVPNVSAGTVSVINTVVNTITTTIRVGASISVSAISQVVGIPGIAEATGPTGPLAADPPAANGPGPRAAADPPGLPVTGSSVQTLLTIAMAMIVMGVALLVVNRRRARRERATY